MDNYACMVLPLNGFGSTGLILIYSCFLLNNGAYIVIVADVSYTGIEKKSMDVPAC